MSIKRYAFRYTGGSWDRIAPTDGTTMPDEYYDGDKTAELVLASDHDRVVEEREALLKLLRELDEYLGPHGMNYIGSGSQLHRQIKAALTHSKEAPKKESGEAKEAPQGEAGEAGE